MDGCNKCCEINTESLTCGSFQVLPWNNDTIIKKIDGWKWCRHVTDFFQYMYGLNQGGMIISIYDISLLQFLFCKITVNLKIATVNSYRKTAIHRMDGCNWNCELTQCLWKKGWLQVLVSKKHNTLENTRSLQAAPWNNDGTTQMYGCKCSFEITIRLK